MADTHTPGEKIAQGKTKTIALGFEPGTVVITSTDDITAKDGVRREKLQDKGMLATRTTASVFRKLHAHGIPTHFISAGRDGIGDNQFVAHQLHMIPVEVVVRRIAFGSYLKRNPGIGRCAQISPLSVEFFHKDDAKHDPLMIIDQVGDRVLYFDPAKPLQLGFIGQRYFGGNDTHLEWLMLQRLLKEGIEIAKSVFAILTQSFNPLGVTLVDAKLEFGIDVFGRLVLGDVVDNDSWRIWPDGDPAKAFDKQVFRDAEEVDEALLGKLRQNYAEVAEMTERF